MTGSADSLPVARLSKPWLRYAAAIDGNPEVQKQLTAERSRRRKNSYFPADLWHAVCILTYTKNARADCVKVFELNRVPAAGRPPPWNSTRFRSVENETSRGSARINADLNLIRGRFLVFRCKDRCRLNIRDPRLVFVSFVLFCGKTLLHFPEGMMAAKRRKERKRSNPHQCHNPLISSQLEKMTLAAGG